VPPPLVHQIARAYRLWGRASPAARAAQARSCAACHGLAGPGDCALPSDSPAVRRAAAAAAGAAGGPGGGSPAADALFDARQAASASAASGSSAGAGLVPSASPLPLGSAECLACHGDADDAGASSTGVLGWPGSPAFHAFLAHSYAGAYAGLHRDGAAHATDAAHAGSVTPRRAS